MSQSNLSIIKTRLAEINKVKLNIDELFLEWLFPSRLRVTNRQDVIDRSKYKKRLDYEASKFVATEIDKQAANKIESLTRSLELAVDALEYITMPLTSEYPTTESLLETLNNDTKRGEYALETIAKILSEAEE